MHSAESAYTPAPSLRRWRTCPSISKGPRSEAKAIRGRGTGVYLGHGHPACHMGALSLDALLRYMLTKLLSSNADSRKEARFGVPLFRLIKAPEGLC